ncbi:Pex12 amino terminal region-domain-containing protein [Abortiporus biennis]|nr:Pex12 amino terminal region-domain-containing protein [Abortiporus biennis]
MSFPSSSSNTTAVWQRLWDEAQPRLRAIEATLSSQSTPSPRISRVGQLDSELLDQELLQLLLEPLTKALNLVNSAFKSYQAELSLLVQLTLYKFSVWDAAASYGAKLQGLKYKVPQTNNKRRTSPSGLPVRTLLIHSSLTMLVPYIHSRIRAHALSYAWPDAPSSDARRKAWDLLTRLESWHGLFGLINFIAFLWNGRYRTLVDRILNLRLIPARRLSKRAVSYEFMNRQMVWHAFTEFLLFLLPLVNTRALRRWLVRLYSQLTFSALLPEPVRSTLGLSDSANKGQPRSRRGKYWALPLDQCAICYDDAASNMNLADPSNAFTSLSTPAYSSGVENPPTESDNVEEEAPPHPINTPYVTDCGHIFCYVCVTSRMMRTSDDRTGVGPGGTRWECLRCGEGVSSVERMEMEVEEVESDFGSYSANGYDEYGSEDMEFTDMSGSMGSYSGSDHE